ncbi:glycosyltransferase family protein [Roseovarius nubinhibens]|uniref:Spore protein YkvP/CgeB glycosyl transferase-like domain-containing protein n=1 Tax=Roseovarius nubinhibens TaxID=314263 RepID=A0A348WB94_9RHOB|nr:hypothetical protein [Roseovarius nubinhibens]|tara:strand:- start:772 stop:1887 length:1116 start_codon:yes stop_codon:yes gene_type:complete
MIDRFRMKWLETQEEIKRLGRYQRPFDGDLPHRLLILGVDHRIPQSQVYPFHYYRRALKQAGVEVREANVARYGEAGESAPKGASAVAIQSTMDLTEAQFDRLLDRVRRANPEARITYMDWFAPTDLRFAAMMAERVDLYLSKHLLRDRTAYGHSTLGDTTLMDFYGRHFGLDQKAQCFAVPDGFWEKLRLAPSFVTAPFMLPVFDRGAFPEGARPIDLHARIAVSGTPWYQKMRQGCAEAVDALGGVNKLVGTGIRHDRFLDELRRSKICFSPFGYGEVCWRDFEAVMCGAVLLKQDMGHVETDPDLFVPGETYVPLRWDLSDFDEVVRGLLADPARRERIARAAFQKMQDYARSSRFVEQMTPLWQVTA